eukprot:7817_1
MAEQKVDYSGNKRWILLFRQTYSKNSSHNIPWKKGQLKLNENNPEAANYAILHEFESFRNIEDNKFELKLFWPNNPELKYQHWKQTTNPTVPIPKSSMGNVIGYEAIDINHTTEHWGGLEWTGNHCHEGNPCLLNGSSSESHKNWFYAVGVYNNYYGKMPAGSHGKQYAVDKVELWVRVSVIPSKSVHVLQDANKRNDKLKEQNDALNGELAKLRAMLADKENELEGDLRD